MDQYRKVLNYNDYLFKKRSKNNNQCMEKNNSQIKKFLKINLLDKKNTINLDIILENL